MTFRIYTDGSCLGNPGPGGWAWAESAAFCNSGREPDTTNQRMELKAALQGLLSSVGDTIIVTDSAYIVNCFDQKWYEQWTSEGRKKSTGERVANWDLWSQIFEFVFQSRADISFEKVKGHSGDPMNEFVDQLARIAAETEKRRRDRA